MQVKSAVIAAICSACAVWAGCGTTKWTDTARTATEQVLLSDSMDRAVSQIDFRALAGKKVFLDDTPIKAMVDAAYLTSLIRQHLMASGGILKEKREDADYVVELRAGAIGTDRHDLLFGVPAITVPTGVALTGMPSQIPEIPFVKRTDQRGVARLALFVYNRNTGRIVWQSGVIPEESRAKATWVFGAGPFQRGTIYKGTKFAGSRFNIPLVDLDKAGQGKPQVAVAEEAFFVEPANKPDVAQDKPADGKPADKPAEPPKDQNAAAPAPAAAPSAPPPTANAPGVPPPTAAAPPPAGVVPASHNAPAGDKPPAASAIPAEADAPIIPRQFPGGEIPPAGGPPLFPSRVQRLPPVDAEEPSDPAAPVFFDALPFQRR